MTGKKHKEKETYQEEFDGTLDQIDQTQLESETNRINLRLASEDPKTPNYNVNEKSKLVYDASTQGDPNPIILVENARFCRSHTFDKETLVQGKESSKTPTFGKTDDTARGNGQ